MQHDVIIACDFKSAEDTFRFLDLFKDEERKPFLKIGMELGINYKRTAISNKSKKRKNEKQKKC